MSKQLTVRLSDELVEFIDRQVQGGEVPSRAAVVADALRREHRRQVAERDAAILSRTPKDHDDLDALAGFVVGTPLDDLA